MSLKGDTAPGYDEISNDIIKLFDESFFNPLVRHIINNIIDTCGCELPDYFILLIINLVYEKEIKILQKIKNQ